MPKTKQVTKLGAEKKAKKPVYTVEISVNNEVYKVSGDTILEALMKYEAPAIVKTDTLVAVTKGNVTKDKELGVFDARRTFANPTAIELLATNLVRQIG